jgi:hypothetical protein
VSGIASSSPMGPHSAAQAMVDTSTASGDMPVELP